MGFGYDTDLVNVFYCAFKLILSPINLLNYVSVFFLLRILSVNIKFVLRSSHIPVMCVINRTLITVV